MEVEYGYLEHAWNSDLPRRDVINETYFAFLDYPPADLKVRIAPSMGPDRNCLED